MKKLKRALPVLLLVVYDCLSVALSLTVSVVANLAYYPGSMATFFAYSWFYYPALIVIFVLVSAAFRRYSGVLQHLELRDVAYQFFAVVSAYALFFLADRLRNSFNLFGFHFQIEKVFIFILAAFLTVLLTILGRSVIRIRLTLLAKVAMAKSNSKRVLIFGAGEAGVFFKRKQDNHPEDRLKAVVFIDDNEQLTGRRILGIPVYGTREKMAEAIDKYSVDEVVVAIPTANRETLAFALEVCKEKHCKIQRFGKLDDVDLNKAVLTNVNYEELLHRDGVSLNMDTVNGFLKDKTVLVTGGVGSIGSEISRQVLSFGCKKLIVFDFNENGLYYINNELLEKYDASRFELRLGSIRDVARLDEVFEEFHPEVVFHAAAHKHVPMSEINPREAIKNNIFGTYKVAMAAIRHHVDKFILISTDKAVNPTNIMGATKRVAELIIQMLDTMSDTDFAAVRFGNVLGSAGSVVPFFKKQIREGGPVTVTHPDMRRYFMTIPEAVQLVLEAGAMAHGGEIFVLDMGEPVHIYDLACDLIRLAGYEPNVDIEIKFTGLRPGEKLFEEIHLDAEDCDKTANKKIFVLKPVHNNATKLSEDLKELEDMVQGDTFGHLFHKVKQIVPTFQHDED